MFNVKGEREPYTPEYGRFFGADRSPPRWPEASETGARLAHDCKTPTDVVRAYAVLAERFPEYPHSELRFMFTHHRVSCSEHSHKWQADILYPGVRWVEARSRTLPDAVFPLVEHNVRRGWRSEEKLEDPFAVLEDLYPTTEIQQAWEAGLDLFQLRRAKPPRAWNDLDWETRKTFLRTAYPGFSDESYWDTDFYRGWLDR